MVLLRDMFRLMLSASRSAGDAALGWGLEALHAESDRFCIDEHFRPSRSRAPSVPTPAKGRAWRHRLLRVPACKGTLVALRPSLKLPGYLMSLWLLFPFALRGNPMPRPVQCGSL